MADEAPKPALPEPDPEAIEMALYKQRKAQADRLRALSPNNGLLDYVLRRRGL